MNDVGHALRRLSDIFERLGLDYVAIGGIAVRAYGIPRPTYDVDFTLAVPRDRLQDLFQAVEECDFSVPEAYRAGWVDSVASLPLIKLRFYLDDRGIDADIFLAETPFQLEMLDRRRRVETPDGVTWLATPEDVVLLKLIANRARDKSDVLDILFVQGQLDQSYIHKWAGQLGISARWEQWSADAAEL